MIQNVLPHCSFCISNVESSIAREIKSRTVLESENFRVFPSLGQITDGGYLLLAPKEHYASIGSLPQELFSELKDIKSKTEEKIRASYHQKPIFLEHGGIGQTIYHAHIHAVPFPEEKDIFEIYHRDFSEYTHLGDISELRDIWKNRGQYLYYEINGHQFAFFTHIVPMYGRIVIADALGVPERANWRTMNRELDEKLIAETLEKMRDTNS